MRESYTNRRAFHHVECYIQHSEILLCFTTRKKRLAGKPNDRPQIDQKSRTRTLCSASLAGAADLVAARRLSLHRNPQADFAAHSAHSRTDGGCLAAPG